MKKLIIIFLCVVVMKNISFSQCPEFYDYNGNLSSNPEWIVCDGTSYNLTLQSDINIGNYTIDWGDGSTPSSGSSWPANSPVVHNYSLAVATYSITITLSDIPCVVAGELTMEEPTNASIQIPFSGLTSICAPGSLEFINSSTDVSENTIFTWSFNDGTADETFDYTNVGQLITHLYNVGTVNCATQVTLTAENECNTLQGGPSVATFTPLRIWDIDEASITASSTLLCYPDVSVSFQNTTDRNCLAQGNVSQRYEYWNLGDYWGLGYDSIIDWRPWPPALNVDVDFPGVGIYEVMLIDSSFCGLDSTTISVNIVDPPIAGLSADDDSICVGESILFHNLTSGFASNYIWDFGDGSSWTQLWGGDILRTFNNPGLFEVLLIPQIVGACRDTARLMIFVSDNPTANFSLDNDEGCDSLSVQISDLSSSDVLEWNWSFDNGNTDSSSTPPLQHYDTTGTYNINLSVTNSSGCTNNHSQQVSVYQTPIPNFQPSSVCVNELSQFSDLSLSDSNDPIINWSWEFGNSGTSTLQNPTYTFNTAGDHEVVLEVSTAHCQAKDTISVNVETIPITDFSTDIVSACSPINIAFTNNSSSNGINYYWDFGDNDTTNLESPTHLFVNNSLNDTSFNVLLTVSTIAGCKDSILKPITVFSNPIASFVNNAVLDCAPLAVDFTNTSQNATKYNWDFNDGTPTDTNTHISHSFDNLSLQLELFDVQLIAMNSNNCYDTTSQTIIVYPQPQFGFSTIPASGCSPLEVNFPSVNGAIDYNWDFGDGNSSISSTPTHVFTNNTITNLNFDVKLVATSPFGCMDSSIQQISVNPSPNADFVISEDSACSPLNTTFTNNSFNANDFLWNLGDGTTHNSNTTINHSYTNTESFIQDYQVQLIVSNTFNCKDTLTESITVFPQVNADFSVDSVGCSPLATYFINNSSGGNNYQWDFGDGNNSSTPFNQSHEYINNQSNETSFYPTLVVESSLGCVDSVQKEISVYPQANADFVISEDEGCHPLTLDLANTSSNSQNYSWDLGDGNTLSTVNITNYQYNNPTTTPFTYTIKLVAENAFNCSDSISRSVMVYPQVQADFVSDSIGCSPLEIDYYNLSIGEDFHWSFGDGTTSNNPNNQTHTFTNNTTSPLSFISSLEVENQYGCKDSTQQEIIVLPIPNAHFTVSENSGCHPFDLIINNSSSYADNYSFNMGDGNTINTNAQTLNYSYDNTTPITQNHTIVLVASINNLCSDTFSTSISVFPKVFSDFIADTAGCSPFSVDFFNSSTNADSYFWDFGNGQIDNASSVATQQYVNSSIQTQIFNTSLISTSNFGCVDTSFQDIYVYPTPTVDFSVSPTIQMLPSSTVNLSNNSTTGNWDYLWDFGDNNQSQLENPSSHTYADFGNYAIQLVMTSPYACTDSATQWIEILQTMPYANFDADAQGCAPLKVDFNNSSLNANSYSWDFGDGTFSSLENPTKIYHDEGTYSVSLTVFNEMGSHSIVKENIIEVLQTPTSQFIVSTDYLEEVGVMLFTTNQSEFADNYLWDFGDSYTTTEFSPSHKYEENGYYTITLIAFNEECSDTSMKNVSVANSASGHIIVPNSFTPNSNDETNGQYNQSYGINDIFYPVILGSKEYEIDIYNRWGEHIFHSDDLSVGWNGYYKGELCQQDVYIYKIYVVYQNNSEEKLVGRFTLVR